MDETDERSRMLWCGNISDKVTEELLYELFLQAGPLESVTIPMERDGKRKPYAFITFQHSVSVQYAIKLFGSTFLFGRFLKLQTRSGSDTMPTISDRNQPMKNISGHSTPYRDMQQNNGSYLTPEMQNNAYSQGQHQRSFSVPAGQSNVASLLHPFANSNPSLVNSTGLHPIAYQHHPQQLVFANESTQQFLTPRPLFMPGQLPVQYSTNQHLPSQQPRPLMHHREHSRQSPYPDYSRRNQSSDYHRSHERHRESTRY